MGATYQIPKFTRARLTPSELIVSHAAHDSVASSFEASEELVGLLHALRNGDARFSAFAADHQDASRPFWRNHKKAVALIIAPDQISRWTRRGRYLLPWLIGDLLAAMRSGKSKRWFKVDLTPKAGCPKRMRIAMQLLYATCEVRLQTYADPALVKQMQERREELLDSMVQHPAARPALAYLMFALMPCVIHFGMMPGQLLRRARGGKDFDALLNLLRLDMFATDDPKIRRLVRGVLTSENQERARLVRRASQGQLPAVSEFMVKVRLAGLFRHLVRDTRLMNTQSVRRVADGVARSLSKGRLRNDRSLGDSNDRFTKEVYRASILYRAISRST